MSIEFLLKKQNTDGGWPYLRGGSWTEPTVYAILALLSSGEKEQAARGIDWIRRTQIADGGWASRPGVGDSSWATALPALLPPGCLSAAAHSKAIEWLMPVRGEDTTPIYRIRQWLLGGTNSDDVKNPGWPWTKGAAAWVGPTTMAILALDAEQKRRPSARLAERVAMGRNYLLAHMCREGGWNHGSNQSWGYQSSAYPETTGMGLLAMVGVHGPLMEKALSMGRQFLKESHSADAQNWLTMGLRAQGQLPANYAPPQGIAYRTVPEVALAQIAAKGVLG